MIVHPITAFRTAKKLNLGGFAELVGAKRAAVWKWERGIGPSPKMAKRIEEKTGIPKERLRPDIFGESKKGRAA